jgi:hypothetical protein
MKQLAPWYANVINGYLSQLVRVLGDPYIHSSTQQPVVDVLQYTVSGFKERPTYDIKQSSEYVSALRNRQQYRLPKDKDFQWVIKALFT